MWGIFRKLKINLPFYRVSPVLGIYPKDSRPYSTDASSTIFIAFLTIARKWVVPSTREWIMKMWYVHSGILFISKEKGNHDFSR